jgi:hypothetical protein
MPTAVSGSQLVPSSGLFFVIENSMTMIFKKHFLYLMKLMKSNTNDIEVSILI